MRKEISQEIAHELLTYSKRVMAILQKYGGSIVPHLIDTDENDGEFLRQAIAKAERSIQKCKEKIS